MKGFLDNIWLKILALVMGLLVWFHVATEKMYTYQVRLPVTKIDHREDLTLATIPPDSVLVTVSAKGKQLVQNAWEQNGLRINMSKLNSGHHTVNLTPENTFLYSPRKNVMLEEVVSPSQIELDLDTRVSVTLPVHPDVVASADDGFAVIRAIEPTPNKVVLTGPRSVIRGLKSLSTEHKDLDGLRNSISIQAAVRPPDGYAMHVDPDTVTLQIDVVPVKTRVYDNMPVVIYHAPNDVRVVTNPPSVRVELAGPPEDIELVNRNALTVAADYRKMSPTGMAPLIVDCPANFQVKGVSADSVRILTTPNAHSGN